MAKEKMAVYFQPETIKKIEQEYQEDNCTSKTEFIEKAVKFYIGYLRQEVLHRLSSSAGRSELPLSDDNRNGQGTDQRYGTTACSSDV